MVPADQSTDHCSSGADRQIDRIDGRRKGLERVAYATEAVLYLRALLQQHGQRVCAALQLHRDVAELRRQYAESRCCLLGANLTCAADLGQRRAGLLCAGLDLLSALKPDSDLDVLGGHATPQTARLPAELWTFAFSGCALALIRPDLKHCPLRGHDASSSRYARTPE